MSTFTSWDDTNASLIPPDASHCSYYADGWAANLNAVRKQCPNALLLPVLIVRGVVPPLKQIVGWEHGVEIDVEPTDWVPTDAAGFAQTCKAAGVMPVFYMPLSDVPLVGLNEAQRTEHAALNCQEAAARSRHLHPYLEAFAAAGLARSDFKLHTAHWTFQPHICSGISSAFGVINADATQWTDKALGRDLDASLCDAGFFSGAAPPPPPPPPPQQKHATGKANAILTIDWNQPPGHKISIHGTSGTWKAGSEQQLEVGQWSFDKQGQWKSVGVPNTTKPLGG